MRYALVFAALAIVLVGGYFLFSSRLEPAAPVGWEERTTAQGLTFSYPEDTGTYVTPESWPPLVERVVNEYGCETENLGTDSLTLVVEERTIGGRPYCVSVSSEGAAGSVYRSYEYSSDRGDSVLRAVFSMRFVQCANFDEPEQTACEAEQQAFDPDTLAHELIESVKLP